MPIRGETIGTAYVRVLADGSGFDDSLRDSLRDTPEMMEAEGQKAGTEYSKGYNEVLAKELNDPRTLERALNRGIGRFNAQGELAGSQLFEGLRDKLEERFPNEIGTVIARNLQEALESGQIDYSGLADRLEDIRPEVAKAVREIVAEQEKIAKESERIALQVEKDAEKEAKILRERGDAWDRFADRISIAFGRGARNDVVNFFGAAIRGVLRVGDIVGAPARALGQFVGEITKLARAGDGMGALIKALSGFGGVALSIGALTVALGTMTAALSLAAGWVVALASSLGFALVGAIGVAAGAMVPLVVGLGVATLAFANMDKEAKRAFKGVTDSFKDLGDIAADEMFANAADGAAKLEGVLDDLGPVVRQLAAGMRTVLEGFIDGLDSPAFRSFAAFVGDTMPAMFISLGQISENLAITLSNIWRAATPFVQEFLGWVTGVTDEWARMTAGAAGQERLTGFFENLRSSLISVSGFLGSVTDLILTILSAGRDTGDSIFDTMAKNVDEWTAALEANPDILNTWFENAEKFGEAVGELIVQIGRLIDELDSPEFRQFATAIVDVLGNAVQSFGLILRPVVELIASLPDELVQVGFAMAAGAIAANKFSTGLQSVGIQLGNVGGKAGAAGGAGGLGGLLSNVRTLAGGAGIGLLIDGLNRSSDAFSGLEVTAGGALAGFAVGGPIGAAIGGTVGAFIALEREAKQGGKAVESAAEAAQDAVVPWEDLTETLDGYTGAVTESTRATLIKKLQEEGYADDAKRLGLTLGDLADAELGNVAARRQVNAAINSTRTAYQNETAEINALVAKRDRFAKDIKNHSTAEIVALDKLIKQKQKDHQETGKLIEQYDQQSQALVRAGRARRIEIANLIDWRKEVRKIPEKLITEMRTEGVPRSLTELGRMADKYNLMPRQVKSLINVLFPNKAPEQVQKFINKLIETGRLKPKPKVDVDDSSAQNKMENINADLTSYDRRTVDANLTVDNSDAMSGISAVDVALARLPGSKDIDIRVETIKSTRNAPASAMGGIFWGAQTRLIGEEGPEAVVPLNRPLAQVDPAVRALSALAQGITIPVTVQNASSVTEQRPIEVTIVTPTKEPGAVAQETINRLVAVGY